ncbi:MAG: hypothetical protein V3U03_17355 [Myxococcota bacterium]
MNKLERRYHDLLELLRLDRQILDVRFEPEKFRLADGSFYTPDFRLILPTGIVEFHEVKGFWREAARVRIKLAAELNPYVFRSVTEVDPLHPKRSNRRIERGSVWIWETFSRGAPQWQPETDHLGT